MADLAGKAVIVTGGGRGLGRAMVFGLAEAGANVCAAAHIEDDLKSVDEEARDLRLPQVPEAPVDTHRPREATAVDSAETTIVPACPKFTTGAHAILAHQDILGGWRVGLTNSSPVLNFEEERGRAPD